MDAGSTAFERHKEALLDTLSDLYERGPNFRPFDLDKSWRRLTRLAQAYFLRQAITPAAEREAKLRKCAAALGDARDLVEQVMQDGAVNRRPILTHDRRPALTHDQRPALTLLNDEFGR
jgi:hypothetical protein